MLVGGDQNVGGGPVVQDAHDRLSGAAHDAGGRVPELPLARDDIIDERSISANTRADLRQVVVRSELLG